MSTIRPRTPCFVLRQAKTGERTATGKPVEHLLRFPERCHELNLSLESVESSVRTDQSASGGRARETVSVTHLMMKPRANVKLGDLIELDVNVQEPRTVKVSKIRPRVDVSGRLHHLEIECETWA